MAFTSSQCIGLGLLFAVFIILMGSQWWHRDLFSKTFPSRVKCNYSPSTPEICLNGIGSKDSCINCSVNSNLVRLTAGELNKYLSYNSPFDTYPIQFINKRGEFINIVRYNDIKCNYDQELIVKGESVVPCIINNVLDAFLSTSFLTQHIKRALQLGILPVNAIPYRGED